jgi:methylenetetrahydrofolate dehydrogenase (NADP+) / methenyltetrahydrofolate cyclohydrolase
MSQAVIIDGKAVAARERARIAGDVAALRRQWNLWPGLAVILVGDDAPSEIYVRNKLRATAAVGMRSFEHRLAANTSQHELEKLVHRLNDDDAVHGILVQLPLPGPLDEDAAIAAVDPRKDVDGLHVHNVGKLMLGRDTLIPCAPLACLVLLREQFGALDGAQALVVGRSNLVGKPVAQLLLRENCTVTVAHSRTRDLAAEARRADIVVTAVGHARCLRGDWIKPGATVIDVGINRVEQEGRTRLEGDVCFAEAVERAGAITPVPGGVGPVTIAMLLRNTVTAACQQGGVPDLGPR